MYKSASRFLSHRTRAIRALPVFGYLRHSKHPLARDSRKRRNTNRTQLNPAGGR